MEEEQQPKDGGDGLCGTAETRKRRLALFIRQESTSLSLVKAGAVNKQIIHCQREMADQPEVTDAAGEKGKSWFGNSPKLKEPSFRHKPAHCRTCNSPCGLRDCVSGNAPEVPAIFLLVLVVAVHLPWFSFCYCQSYHCLLLERFLISL